MKTKQNAVNGPESFTAYLAEQMKNPNGKLTLDQIVSGGKIDKYEAVDLLKKSKVGRFITGRRGHSSRFVWGAEEAKETHIPSSRKQPKAGDFVLRVRAGKFIHTVPVDTMELVPA